MMQRIAIAAITMTKVMLNRNLDSKTFLNHLNFNYSDDASIFSRVNAL